MTRISARVTGIAAIAALADDLADVPVRVVTEGSKVVRKNVRRGRTLARANARRNSPSHGKHHDDAITDEMLTALSGEFGPDESLPQGNMDFEYGGGRQSAPHLNVTHAGDVVAAEFPEDVRKMLDRIFW